MSYWLALKAQIVHYLDFENGLVKIQQGNSVFLTHLDRQAINIFKISRPRVDDELGDDSIVSRACKR